MATEIVAPELGTRNKPDTGLSPKASQCVCCVPVPHRFPRSIATAGNIRELSCPADTVLTTIMDMRIVVTGDRCLECRELAVTVLRRLLARYGPDIVIVHGGESGVDQSFSAACQELGLTTEVRLANWHRTGLPTIGQKNHELIKGAPDLCLAVHYSIKTSKRTRDCVHQALQAGIPSYLIENERAIPKRLRRGDTRLK